MSTDESVTKDIIETLEDGKDGFTKGAETLGALDQASLVTTFQGLADQRSRFADDLQKMASEYGDDVDKTGSMAAKVHRGWMSLKDALSKSDAKAVLDVAKQGEDHAVTEYEKALSEDISAGLRAVLETQFAEIKTARSTISSLVDSHA
ncbi:MAG: PA2169 family four-helix-bundle protein [Ilumatobacteraceae bacterium]